MKHNLELGQHFMTDTALIERIVKAAHIKENDVVLEIGPGEGVLTSAIAQCTSHIITVEQDKRFEATHHANILDIIDTLEFTMLVSNLPYHISEPLFISLLSKRPESIVVVVGSHFADHLEQDTILGSVVQDVYDFERLEEIPPSSFNPPPNVHSALIRLKLKSSPGALAQFYEYSKSKVKNFLKTLTTKRGAQDFINKLPLAVQEKKLYTLNREEFLQVKAVVEEMN